LNRVFLGDQDVIKLFEEMIGGGLIKKAMYGKAMILYGSGANGKSTILDMLKSFVGIRNYSAVPLEDLCRRPFAVAELENKLFNIGDDIDNALIKDSGTLKRIFDGNSTQVERKGERPFTLSPTALNIFSANTIPASYDKSDGFYRRWCIIPFQAKFTPNSEDYDPMLIDKLTTPEAKSYLLNLGLRGAQRLLSQGHYTEPACVSALLYAYKVDNSTVLSWMEDTGRVDDEEYFLTKSDRDLYTEYLDWCRLSGINKPSAARQFYNDIIKQFDFEKKKKQKHDGKRYFVVKL
jgi:putative DNA primase/helicase